MHPLIELEGVEKSYGESLVLSLNKLTLREGDRILIHGRNGSGKSTLLRLLGRVSQPDRGTIRFADSLRGKWPGYVPQLGGLFGGLSLIANLEIREQMFGPSPDISQCLLKLGLTSQMEKRFSQLSGGYKRLAAVAAALAVSPTWLLLDEPFGWLDEINRTTLVDVLTEFVQNIPLVLICAPERESVAFVNRYVHLQEGRLCSES